MREIRLWGLTDIKPIKRIRPQAMGPTGEPVKKQRF